MYTFDFSGVTEKTAWSPKLNAYSKPHLMELRDLLKEGKVKSIPKWAHSMACQSRSCSGCKKACKACIHCRWNGNTRNRYPCIVSPCIKQWNPQVSTSLKLHSTRYFILFPPPQITTDAAIKPTPSLFSKIRGSALTDKGGMVQGWLDTGFIKIKGGDKKHFVAVLASGLIVNYLQARKSLAQHSQMGDGNVRARRFMQWLMHALEDAFKAGISMAKLHAAFFKNRKAFHDFFVQVGRAKGETSFEKVVAEYKHRGLHYRVFRDYVMEYPQEDLPETEEEDDDEWDWSTNVYYMYRRGDVNQKTKG